LVPPWAGRNLLPKCLRRTMNYFNYFTEVEEYFIRKRSKSLFVSPLDWCLIELWKENDVPLHIVMRGIDRSFEAAGRRGKKPPSTLFYCHPAVMEALEEYQEARTGLSEESAAPSPDPPGLTREHVAVILAEIAGRLEGRPEAPYARALARLSAVSEEWRRTGWTDYQRLDRELAEIQAQLLFDLKKELSPDRLREVEREVRKETKIYKKRLSEEMYERLKASYLERRLREIHALPAFSLLEFRVYG
jgi:hypothetical protein